MNSVTTPPTSAVNARHDDQAAPSLLTPAEVGGVLGGIPEKTLANWRSQRKGPLFVRIGIHVRYRREDVDAWLAERLEDGRRWMAS